MNKDFTNLAKARHGQLMNCIEERATAIHDEFIEQFDSHLRKWTVPSLPIACIKEIDSNVIPFAITKLQNTLGVNFEVKKLYDDFILWRNQKKI